MLGRTAGVAYVFKQNASAASSLTYFNHWDLSATLQSVTGVNSYFGVSVDIYGYCLKEYFFFLFFISCLLLFLFNAIFSVLISTDLYCNNYSENLIVGASGYLPEIFTAGGRGTPSTHLIKS